MHRAAPHFLTFLTLTNIFLTYGSLLSHSIMNIFIQSLLPKNRKGPAPAILGLHGHGSSKESICTDTKSAQLVGPMLAKKGYVVGVNIRIVQIDTKTDATREFVYPMDDAKNGVNEILAINDHEFLVVERDNKAGTKATPFKLRAEFGAIEIKNLRVKE